MISNTEKVKTIAFSLVANGFGVKMKNSYAFVINDPSWPLAWYVAYGSLCGYLSLAYGPPLDVLMHFKAVIMSSCDIADAIRLTDEPGDSTKAGEQ